MCFTSHNAILVSIQICCFLVLKKNLLIFFVKLFFALLCYCVPYFVPQSIVRFRFQFLITNFGSVFFKLLPLYLRHVCVSSVLILGLPLCRVFIQYLDIRFEIWKSTKLVFPCFINLWKFSKVVPGSTLGS